MRTVAIIQARMGSTRLPGKVLMPLAGKPVLWHIIHRLRKCRHLDAIAIATSTHAEDDPIETFALNEGIQVVRGPKENVLARYVLAAEKLDADIIVRVTGDAPLIDPATIDDLINTLIQKQVDYCVGDPQFPSIHEGFSPFTRHALQKLVHEAGDDSVAMEHVTAYFKKHPGFVRVAYVSIDPDYRFSGGRISVDTPADLRFLEEIYARLKPPAGEADVREVVRLLRAEPDLLKINAHVHQKSIQEKSKRILFLTTASRNIGFGHLSRITALATELLESAAVIPRLVINCDDDAVFFVRRRGIEPSTVDFERDLSVLKEMFNDKIYDVVVIDMKYPLPDELERLLKSSKIPLITIDMQPDQLEPELTFIPAVNRKNAPPLKRANTFRGNRWIMLDRMINFYRCIAKPSGKWVLVAGGGSIHNIEKLLPKLKEVSFKFPLLFVIGPYVDAKVFEEKVTASGINRYKVLQNPDSPLKIYAECKAAILIFGVTSYETIALGIPTIIISARNNTDIEIVKEISRQGACLDLINDSENKNIDIASKILLVLEDESLLKRLSDSGQSYINGYGCNRIAEKILDLLRNEQS